MNVFNKNVVKNYSSKSFSVNSANGFMIATAALLTKPSNLTFFIKSVNLSLVSFHLLRSIARTMTDGHFSFKSSKFD